MTSLDLHVHTRVFSPCASADPVEVLRAAMRAGLDGIAITEHDIEWPAEQMGETQYQANAERLLVIVGQEVRTWENGQMAGDFLCFGFHLPVNDRLTPKELVKAVHSEGGIIIPAHACRPFLGAGERIFDLEVDAIEIFSTNSTAGEQGLARKMAEKMGLPQVAGSDAHEPHLVGAFFTVFQQEIKGEGDLIVAIRNGLCSPGISLNVGQLPLPIAHPD